MNIKSVAPVRVDLSGGTVDIWPLYLMIPGAVTTNLGIDLFAETELVETQDGQGTVTFKSSDQNTELKIKWSELEKQKTIPQLVLHQLLTEYFYHLKKEDGSFNPKSSLMVSTRATSPAGAGLGGSSALCVSIIAALSCWLSGKVESELDGERFISVAKDVESRVIQAPAGLQDYYGAVYGGLQSIEWGVFQHKRNDFGAELLQDLQSRMILFYSGLSRNSGINNWQVFKDFFDKKVEVRKHLESITSSTLDLNRALSKGDWNGIIEAIRSEWAARRQLAPGISTPEMDQAFKRAEKITKDIAYKVCGAGGGGCFFLILKESNDEIKAEIIEAVTSGTDIRHLPFHAVPYGVSVKPSLS
ncbi:MAG: hypothetical protein KA715_13300 [Xanthomonadaceae bacterium]|nr:hypothetical protein [Xanthomonadaceae bacterium]